MLSVGEFRGEFRRRFSNEPLIIRAPGRVNLIGEHTDYNDGFVMPVAIDFYTWAAIALRHDGTVNIHSQNFDETVSFRLQSAPRPRHHWSDYPIGVIEQLRPANSVRGADILIHGEVPIGAGLSSSAAIEVATGFAVLYANKADVDRTQLALLCQRAENEFVGMRCGIMDQFISCHGKLDRALMLDCRTLAYKLLPLPDDVRLVICNTMVKHQLAGGEYNDRRAASEAGVAILKKRLPRIRALRDVSVNELDRYCSDMPEVVFRRCRHIVTENDRVQCAADALKQDNLAEFGRLMAQSHNSLRDDYEVSCRELDLMVGIADRQPGTYGARMTGGGFGGCTVNLVSLAHVEAFRTKVAHAYEQETGLKPEIYITPACDGVGQVA
ncbi:MAG: galactokinase [Acidobacteria bacterium]|nr:galactokinase [Acidobacteriota bacterium]MBV9436203.1 galactokinase [Acidobacteriota bacterium]